MIKAWRIFGRYDIAMNDILSRYNQDTRKAFLSFFNQLANENLKIALDDEDPTTP
jgi:hypothetical protein